MLIKHQKIAKAIIKTIDSLGNYFDEDKMDNDNLLGELVDEIMPFTDQLINSTKEECAKKLENDKLFNVWWDKMSKGSSKDELIEKRLARNVWMASRFYHVKAIRDKE